VNLKEETAAFAVGHMSLAYLLGKGSAKPLRVKPNIAALLVLSILPDIDILWDLFTGTEIHRGPTHSIIVAIVAFIPLFIYLRKRAVPYFIALISHPLLGDFFVGGKLELFWPISNQQFGLHELGGPYIDIFSPINVAAELILFAGAMLLLYKSGDWRVFTSGKKSNLLLIIPIATVLLPSTIGYPFTAPLILTEPALAVAHFVYLMLFLIAVLKTFQTLYKMRLKHPNLPSKPPP